MINYRGEIDGYNVIKVSDYFINKKISSYHFYAEEKNGETKAYCMVTISEDQVHLLPIFINWQSLNVIPTS